MSFMDSLKSVFAGKSAAPGRDTGRVYLVDAEKMAESRDGRTGPVERFQAIQQLSRFAEREKIEVVAVVGGRPLREVAHGDAFNGVRVFYVEANDTMADTMQKVLAEHVRGRAVVITNDKQLEARLADRGVDTLRVSTLRKAFENGGEGGDPGRSQQRRQRRGPRGERGDRGERQERTAPPSDEASSAGSGDAPAEPAAEGPSRRSSDTIDNLIDRVN